MGTALGAELRLEYIPYLFAIVVATLACGAPSKPAHDTDTPSRMPTPADVAARDEGGPEDVPRPRSEPPPRPPPPSGITVLRRDAITLALSGDGQFLAAGDLAGQALLWDLPRGRFVWADPTPQGNRLGRVVFAAAAPIYLGGSFHEPDRPWRLWSAELLERRGELGESGWIGLDAALDDKGTRALTLSSSRDGTSQRLELWDLTRVAGTSPGAPNAPNATPLVTMTVARATRGAVALDAAGARFALADELGAVTVMALAADATAAAADVVSPSAAVAAAVSPSAAVAAAVSPSAAVAAAELFRTQSETGSHEDSRVSKLALSADGMTLYGSIGARLMTWPLGPGGKTTSLVVGARPDAPTDATGLDPIRGLHRVARTDAVTLVVVTRPVAGGLRFFAGDGRALGQLDSGCRCEIHALSADAKVAACGCTEGAELRWGRLTLE